MGFIGYAGLALVLALAVLLFLASRKPDTFRVERRAIFRAAPEMLFTQINDLVAWQAWSPWAKKDLNAKASFGAITAGDGAQFAWDGNNQVGKGSMTIVSSKPHEHVHFRLDFEKPFKASNIAEFTLSPKQGGTELVWAMHGSATLMSKVMDVLMNMDKMVGKDFEAGLNNLRVIVENRR